MTSRQTPQGTLTYSYDAAGNLISTRSSNENGASVNYTYDAANRLATAIDNRLPSGSATTRYAYDANGNLATVGLPNTIATAYTYNTLNRLTNLSTTNTSATVASYGYTLGAAGNRLSVTEGSGRTVAYAYDALLRLTRETITNDGQTNGEVGYGYNAVGNRLTRTSTVPNVTASTSAYDANDRLASDTYDAAGNTVNANGNVYSYDFENRLVAVNGGAIRYDYDGDGNRVSKAVGGVTTAFLVDTNNPTGYAQVVDEMQGGQVTRTYVYGHDLISQRQLINNEWATSFYGYDGHGSVRYLTNSEGSVTDTYAYDAFGTLIASTGTTPNVYLYAGERFDAETGMYHLRARYMNPNSGRFWTQDSYEGSNADPLSLHKYLYAHADPVNNTDPSGLYIFAEAQAVQIRTTISAQSALQYQSVLRAVQPALIDSALAEIGTAAVATTATSASAGTALSSLLAFFTSAAIGTAIVSSTGGSPNRQEEHEIFYRVMSSAEYNGLGPNGEITIGGTENFVSQSPEYVIQLAARHPHLYQHLVVYAMQSGTRNALIARGATSNYASRVDPELSRLPSLSTFPRNYPDVVHVKRELGGINYGLRRGTVGIFNSRIVSHQGVKL